MKNITFITSLILLTTASLCYAKTESRQCKKVRSAIVSSLKSGKNLRQSRIKLFQKSCNKTFRLGSFVNVIELPPVADSNTSSKTKCVAPGRKTFFCTEIFQPVSKIFSNNTCKTFSNECFAKNDFSCVSSKIVPGTCDENGFLTKDDRGTSD